MRLEPSFDFVLDFNLGYSTCADNFFAAIKIVAPRKSWLSNSTLSEGVFFFFLTDWCS